MKLKWMFIIQLIPSIFINLILFWTFFHFSSVIECIIFLPFLICGISVLGKTISLFLEKEKIARFFENLFTISLLVYVVGFLIVWFAVSISNNNFFLSLFAIPFFIIVFLIIKRKFGQPKYSKKIRIQSYFNLANICTFLLIGVTFGIGLLLFANGLSDVLDDIEQMQGFQETTGTLTQYNENTSMPNLLYSYSVDGKIYLLEAEWNTDLVPRIGSTRIILFDPAHPDRAVLKGNNSNFLLLLVSFIFLTVSFAIGFAFVSNYRKFPNISKNILNIVVGLFFFLMGFGLIYYLTGSISIIRAFQNYSPSNYPPIIILIFFILAGILIFIEQAKQIYKIIHAKK